MKNSVFCWSHPISDLLLSLFSCWHLDSSHVLFGMKFQQYPSFPGLVLVSNWLIILSLLTLHISRAGAGMNTNLNLILPSKKLKYYILFEHFTISPASDIYIIPNTMIGTTLIFPGNYVAILGLFSLYLCGSLHTLGWDLLEHKSNVLFIFISSNLYTQLCYIIYWELTIYSYSKLDARNNTESKNIHVFALMKLTVW